MEDEEEEEEEGVDEEDEAEGRGAILGEEKMAEDEAVLGEGAKALTVGEGSTSGSRASVISSRVSLRCLVLGDGGISISKVHPSENGPKSHFI